MIRPSNAKKKLQLGIDPGTAAARLIRDLLWGFVQKTGVTCHRCGYHLTRETFSIDHKTPWLDSENPRGLFFDTENISYSHLACNVADGRKPHAWTKEEMDKMPEEQRLRILADRKYARERYKRMKKR